MYKLVRLIIIICSFNTLISCKNDKVEEPKVKSDAKEFVSKSIEPLSIAIIFESDEEGEIVATFSEVDYKNQNVIYKVVGKIKEGNNEFKALMFGDYISTLVQIDFGRKIEKKLTFVSATIEYRTKKIEISKENLQTYFYINKFIDYNKETGLITTKRVNNSLAPIITVKKSHMERIFDLI